MIKEFIDELREKALKNNLDFEALVEKYTHRYNLAIEAGLGEEEAINRLGTIEDIISRELALGKRIMVNDAEGYKMRCLSVEMIAGDVEIVQTANPGVEYEMDRAAKEQIEIIATDDKFIVQSNGNHKMKGGGSLKIMISKDLSFETVRLSAMSADFDIDCDFKCDSFSLESITGDFEINGEVNACAKASISVVSGDIYVENVSTRSLDISTVSGDVSIDLVEAKKANIDTVSGDITICGSVDVVNKSSVSGHIKILK